MQKSVALLIPNDTNTATLHTNILANKYKEIPITNSKSVGLFSNTTIAHYIDLEDRLAQKILTKNTDQALKTMSSGERKKLLLHYLLAQNYETLLLINPYDNLDVATQEHLKKDFDALSKTHQIIQVVTRPSDILPSISQWYYLTKDGIASHATKPKEPTITFTEDIPQPLTTTKVYRNIAKFTAVSVSFGAKKVLKNINWTIKPGEFWQLIGPNGSGKSTLLNIITGDSPMGYGQNLELFGHKKGSGESVWDIKKMIGYFSPAMVDKFKGYHTVENMLIAGLHDSVGLYTIPNAIEKNLAKKWLNVLGFTSKANSYFKDLSTGDQRLLMVARAMIKHPPLLILDEPTVGLDDEKAALFVALVNTYSKQSKAAILYVSHRQEANLKPSKQFVLTPTEEGSIGRQA
ncbi:ATP-binding cassette domain-containing protein [Croceivirga sp. JEA036]|uniref:ATP-binding cassette domain-containing protein n=1 Tax=Croceivirga sp. JEA036 TaxID=2721162 RepID=UPI00143C6808|nr:ATP-binding cassette domain-containing protein [Croceivirga sp. JEA036]NJB37358.1 ATP-binding cassette domain-containing protein [Croceivirga sp. JEA036]